MPGSSPLRVATIGTSMITGRFLDTAALVDDVVVDVVVSRDAAKARALADEHGIARATDDLDAALAGVDAVYVASPNGIHAEQTRRALDAGRHVLVEKPATPTADEFTAVLRVAADRGLVVFEAMRNVHMPAFAYIRGLVPRAGRVRRVAFSYCQRSARYDRVLAGERVNIFDPALAGGALLDLGVYCVGACVDLFGEPRQVRAFSTLVAGGADGSGAALLEYDGFVADLAYSKITASTAPCEIQGELGTITFDSIAEPSRIRFEPVDGSVGETAEFPVEAHGMVHEILRFVDLVRGGDDDRDGERTLATLRTTDAIRAAVG